MASGQTLMVFLPQSIDSTATNFAPINMRNQHPVLEFATATNNRAHWTAIMPTNYSGTGIKAIVSWAMATATATSGVVAWLMSWERMTATQDLDSDGFGSTSTATHVETPDVNGILAQSTLTVTATADLDSLTAGDTFRFRLTRHVATDTATGKAQVVSVELQEA